MEIELNKVYQMDCFDMIPHIKNNSIDLIVTDPPFGDNIAYGKMNRAILGNESEEINYRYMDAVYSKLKENSTMYIFTNHKFEHLLKQHAIKTGWNYRMTIVLVKNNFGLGYGFRNQHEFILVLEKGKAKYNLKDFSNVIQMKHVNHTEDSHPHRKDYDVIRKIILHSSKEGDTVLDSFMGAFTTAIACHREKRNFIGTELDERWCKKYQKELDAEINQLNLF
jgi:site-specific DNA-methyltransferase (adenine-specific)